MSKEWTADKGNLYFRGQQRACFWMEGDSLHPDHALAIHMAATLNAQQLLVPERFDLPPFTRTGVEADAEAKQDRKKEALVSGFIDVLNPTEVSTTKHIPVSTD